MLTGASCAGVGGGVIIILVIVAILSRTGKSLMTVENAFARLSGFDSSADDGLERFYGRKDEIGLIAEASGFGQHKEWMVKMKKQLQKAVMVTISTIFLAGCGNPARQEEISQEKSLVKKEQTITDDQSKPSENKDSDDTEQTDLTAREDDNAGKDRLLCPDGKTLAERFDTPKGYSRTQAKDASFLSFLRQYPLKEDGSPVLLYDQTPKSSQSSHAAVFQLPIEQEDLQQCADSVMRVYAEYYWHTKQYERIGFHFVNGFYAEYAKWREGYRIQINGNETSWAMTAAFDDSYENFQKYLRMVFAYAGTLSMEQESEEIQPAQIRAGDVFLKGASPGHVVMVVDLCKNEQGEKAFLLAQGYMPAQEFHVLKNPMHEDDPWYYETEVEFPFVTPEYTFYEGSLRRLKY